MAASIANLSNFRRNKHGGVDADKTVEGEVHPYTLTDLEKALVPLNQIGPVDISKIKNAALEEVNQQRDQRIHGGIEYNGHTFQTDAQSILDVMGAVIAQVQVDWLTANNQTVSMSSADMAALGQALAAHKGSLVHQARTHKDNILAMTTASEIENYMGVLSWQ